MAKRFKEWIGDAFELLPSYVKFGYYIGALGVLLGIPTVPRYLLFICFFLTTIMLFRPICEDISIKIRMWAIRKFPEQYNEYVREKKLKMLRKNNPGAYADMIVGNRR